jgi:GTP pyrophosphokinase
MVQVRKSYPQNSEGELEATLWIKQLPGFKRTADKQRMQLACVMAGAAQRGDTQLNNGKVGCFHAGLEMATILSELHLDEASLIAAVIYRAVREKRVELDEVKKSLGKEVAHLIDGVLRMAAISSLRNENTTVLGQGQAQVDNVRKMLVAMVDDVRVGLIKLAERTQAIRAVKNQPLERQQKVANEVFDVYAPLAHRLGIGQIKWELEDLSFRYLHPEAYSNIAKMLDGRRLDRQEYIDEVVNSVQRQLDEAGIEATVSGRVKHIYSIWRKMQRKGVNFDQLYDIRAIRVLVSELNDCYAALGIVHTLWRNIPNEFDDYIANPKLNGYRSLHTAVIGPESKVLEVQIRTEAMHEEAELGVCAHWLYKGTDVNSKSQGYEQKIEWLRQVLDWHEEHGGAVDIGELTDELAQDFGDDRIYVFTPLGHVVDVAFGSTPVDFAYHIHTEVGHKCRGAKVDGRIVPLNTVLQSGQQVEILTGNEVMPSRDWLRSSLGYLNSHSARSKVRAWFKKQAREENLNAGRSLLDKELKRLSMTSVDYKVLAEKLHFATVDDLYTALGAADIAASQVLRIAEKLFYDRQESQAPLFSSKALPSQIVSSAVTVSGVGNLLTVNAKCCKPLPGDEIVGYVTLNRGVTIHRKDCRDFLQSEAQQPERVIQVNWIQEQSAAYPVDVAIEAYDRTGLLGDITGLLSAMRVNVININTHSDRNQHTAHMKLTLEIYDIEQLVKLLGRLSKMPNIISATRIS